MLLSPRSVLRGLLQPGDRPGLTAVRITPTRGAGRLAVHAVEICVE